MILFAQTDVENADTLSVPDKYPFIEKNVITDDSLSLSRFYEQLYAIRPENDTIQIVSILHIGDSHLQAGFIVEPVREKLQQEFGNAGRGLIAPLKLSKSNEPPDYKITSGNSWATSRCIQRNSFYQPGITGITIASKDSLCDFEISLLREGERFNKVSVLHNQDAEYKINSPNDTILYFENESVIYLPNLASSLDFSIEKTDEKDIEIQGFSLENGNNGIIYHSMGVNGAHFSDYTDKTLFLSQSAILHPNLIIISLGTNEAYNGSFSESIFYHQIDSMIKPLQRNNPEACVLLTTPGEGFRKYKKMQIPNKKIKDIAEIIIQYAKDNKLAYWDLFTISGGENSSRNWKKYNLIAADGVHFTKEGYKLQGTLLFQALIDGYNRYISDRLE